MLSKYRRFFSMKCKQQRQSKKGQDKARRDLLAQLRELNPKLEIALGDKLDAIFVNASDVKKLQLPERCHLIFDKETCIMFERHKFTIVAWK